jgi:hypothetical protein
LKAVLCDFIYLSAIAAWVDDISSFYYGVE